MVPEKTFASRKANPAAPSAPAGNREPGFAPVAFVELAKTFTMLADQCFDDGRLDTRSLVTEYEVLSAGSRTVPKQAIRLLAAAVEVAGSQTGRELHIQARLSPPDARASVPATFYDHGDGQATGWKVNCALRMRENLASVIMIHPTRRLHLPPFDGEEVLAAPKLNNLRFYLTRQRDLRRLP